MLKLKKFIWVKTWIKNKWLFLLFIIITLYIPAASSLTEELDSNPTYISSKEQRQATQLKILLEKENLLIHDILIKETLEQVIKRLTKVLPNQVLPIDVLLINDHEINAFAGPAGVMGINTGLILTCKSVDEFAGVMAHELAHHSQQHLLRRQQYQSQLRLPQIASIISAIALSTIDPQLGMGAMSIGSTLGIHQQLSFSREMEMEADRMGIVILKKAGFDSQGLIRFFGYLSTQEQLNQAKPNSYLRTHPHSYERLAEIVEFDKEKNSINNYNSDLLHYDFLYALERTRVLYTSLPRTIAFYEKIKSPLSLPFKSAWNYGYAYALAQEGQLNRSWNYLKPLLATENQQISIYPLLLAAELLTKEGNHKHALHYFAKAWQQHPHNQAAFWSYLHALHLNQHDDIAEQLLNKKIFQSIILNEDYLILATQIYVANHHSANAYYLRAQHAKQFGQKTMAKRYLQTALQQNNIEPSLRAHLNIELDKMKLIEK